MRWWRLAAGAALLALASCAEAPPPADRLTLQRVDFSSLPGWRDDRVAEALPALRRSCARLLALPPERPVGPRDLGGTGADWRPPCNALNGVPDGDEAAVRAWLAAWFVPYRAANNGRSDGLFTGYYVAELRGSRQAGGRYTVPIHGRPSDLVTVDLGQFKPAWKGETITGQLAAGKLRPYPTRAEIERGALDGMAQPILWVDDPLDALLLHIQGSGRVTLDDGGTAHVGFAASNGQPFLGIGRLLLDTGRIRPGEASMQSILAWLRAHPDEAPGLLARNGRYIFFRELEGEGPIGAQGVALTPERSLAVDLRHVPLGIPLWLSARDPDGRPLDRLMVAQDTGSAITGPVRGDFFWGFGAAAFEKAGRMKSRGEYYLLLPRATAPAMSGRGLAIAAAGEHPEGRTPKDSAAR